MSIPENNFKINGLTQDQVLIARLQYKNMDLYVFDSVIYMGALNTIHLPCG